MDATLTPEEQLLVETAQHVAGRISSVPGTAGTDGWDRLRGLGWSGLRRRSDGRAPDASGVYVGLVAEAFGARLTTPPFLGATFGAELLALSGAPADVLDAAFAGETVVVPLLDESLTWLAGDGEPSIAWDANEATHGVLATPNGDGAIISLVDLVSAELAASADESRVLACVPSSASIVGVGRLGPADLSRWLALGLASIACELAGVMDAALALAVRHAKDRSQFGRSIASFQAIQHLCADQLVSIEAARSCAYYAAWAVDELPPTEALLAARTAKVYGSQAALRVAEAAIQIHGGLGMTWECDAHRYLRRVLLDRQTLGGEDTQLDAIADERMRAAA